MLPGNQSVSLTGGTECLFARGGHRVDKQGGIPCGGGPPGAHEEDVDGTRFHAGWK